MYSKALVAGDIAGVKRGVTADRVKEMDSPDFKKMFGLVQALQPKNIKITGGTMDGDTATLLATGKDESGTTNGTITMVKEGGAWKVKEEEWKSKS